MRVINSVLKCAYTPFVCPDPFYFDQNQNRQEFEKSLFRAKSFAKYEPFWLLLLYEMKKRMFSEVEIDRDVAICVKQSQSQSQSRSQPPHQQILSRLLRDLINKRASKKHGFYLAITSLNTISIKRDHDDDQSQVLTTFHVSFTCRTFLPSKGDILQGVVQSVCGNGVFIRSGPLRYVYLSSLKMPNYRYFPGNNREEACFRREDMTKIEVGVVLRFKVLAVRFEESFMFWNNRSDDFYVLASLKGDDTLGPVSLTGPDEPYM